MTVDLTVDVHSHFFPKNIPDFARKFGGEWPNIRHLNEGKAMITMGGNNFRPIDEACWNPEIRLEEMDRNQIGIQVICTTPLLFGYDKPANQIISSVRYYNDQAIAICKHNTRRLKAMAQVPLQDIDLACKELERVVDIGHIGVQIGNHVSNKNLDDQGLVTFLHHAADIGMPVFVHPWDMMSPERMPKYMLQWLVAMPAETQLSILSLILSGAFERLPKSLKICFAHGGGSFAFLIGRVDNAWRQRDIVRTDCPNLPSSYIGRFYTDSAVFSDDALQLLVKTIGQDKVMLGSDYPFPLGEKNIGSLIRETDQLTAEQKKKILTENALEFFNPKLDKSILATKIPARLSPNR